MRNIHLTGFKSPLSLNTKFKHNLVDMGVDYVIKSNYVTITDNDFNLLRLMDKYKFVEYSIPTCPGKFFYVCDL